MTLLEHLVSYITEGNNEKAKKFLQDDPSYLRDIQKDLLLQLAVLSGNKTITKYLIGKGCNVNALSDNGNTLLIYAAKLRNNGIIRVLLEANASVLVTNDEEESAARIIIGHWTMKDEILIATLKKVKEECSNDSLQTAEELLKIGCTLPRAVILEDITITKYMLENGCNVNDPDMVAPQLTALHQAVIGSDLENVKLLINFGADVNSDDILGRRVIDFVTDEQILQILLDNGAQVITDDGNLVAGRLFKIFDKNLVDILMQQSNVNLSVKEEYGLGLIHRLVLNAKFDPVGILKNNINSFDINQRDHCGTTILMRASSAGNVDTVEFLLKQGANVNIVSENEDTALSFAFYGRETKAQTKILTLLLQYGADAQYINSLDSNFFDSTLRFKCFDLMKIILGHLVLMDDQGCEIKDFVVDKVYSHDMFENYSIYCKIVIENLKRIVIKGRVTLFDFLTCSGDAFIKFACNEELVSRVKKMMYYKRRYNLYYFKVLRLRIVKAMEVLNLKKNALQMVSQIRQLQNNSIITEKIVHYLIYDDLKIIASCPTFNYIKCNPIKPS